LDDGVGAQTGAALNSSHKTRPTLAGLLDDGIDNAFAGARRYDPLWPRPCGNVAASRLQAICRQAVSGHEPSGEEAVAIIVHFSGNHGRIVRRETLRCAFTI